MFARRLLLAVAAALSAAAVAPAQTYQYEWEIGGVAYTSGSSYTFGTTGSVVSINLYIRESTGGTTLSTSGLSSAHVLITTSQPVNGLRVLADSNIVPNDGAGQFSNTPFNERYAAYDGNPAQHLLSVNAPFGSGVKSGVAGGKVLLGRFDFTVQGQTATTLTAEEEPGGLNYDNFLNGQAQPIAVGLAVFNLNPVPEPTGLVAVALVAVVAARRRVGRS